MKQLIKQDREPFNSLILYHLLKWSLVSPVLHTGFKVKIHGIKNVPSKGPIILTSNHASYLDPLLISSGVGRPVAYMAKQELFKVPVLQQLIKLYGAYPVKRSMADRQSIRSAINALNQGWAVGIFLEGTRTVDARIHNPKLGAALIASMAQVPLLPVSLWGTEKVLVKGSSFPRFTPLTVRIGEIIAPPPSNDRQELINVTDKCANSINYLHALGR
jgi:1-acyl-sn-glycerol-3-phosphate acyltransferase